MLPLRDASCQFLLEALRPHNCCSLLMRSYAINCEPLTQRCLDTLTLDFVAVVECDPGFVELGAAVRLPVARALVGLERAAPALPRDAELFGRAVPLVRRLLVELLLLGERRDGRRVGRRVLQRRRGRSAALPAWLGF